MLLCALVWLLSFRFIPMLIGQELLDLVASHPEMTQKQLAEAAGYTRVTVKGEHQVTIKRFMAAMLEAKGVTFTVGKAPGKLPSYTTTVHKSGVILLGKNYSDQLGVETGDVLDIVFEEDRIILKPALLAPTASGAPAAAAAPAAPAKALVA